MKIKELKEILNRHNDRDEDTLVIVISMPSIGPRASSEITHGSFGFDWENHKFIFTPKDKLSVKSKEEDVYHMSVDLLMDLATSKTNGYNNKIARNILKKAGYTEEQFEKFRHLFHKEDK